MSSFQGFWGARDVAVAGAPDVDEDGRSADVPLTIDGRRQDFRLQLAPAGDGTWLVDGPRPR